MSDFPVTGFGGVPLLAVVTPGELRRSGIGRSPRWLTSDGPSADPDGTGVPDITDTHIHFNGVRHCGHTKMAQWYCFRPSSLPASIFPVLLG